MKICFLSDAQSIHTTRWARHFRDRGDEVTVISFDPGEIEGIRLIALPPAVRFRPLNILLQMGRIRRLVRQVAPDILHAHYVTSYGLAGALCGWTPFVATAWGTDVLISSEESWLYRWMVRFVLRRADLVTAMAPHMTDHLVQRKYAPRSKILTLPFGVDTERFNPSQRTRGHGAEVPAVVSTRHLSSAMDVDTLIRAIPLVLKARPKEGARFLIANEGPERHALEELAAGLGVTAAVTFVGPVSHEAMPSFLGQADLFVSTSPSDGNNISLNEAMACGAFPVATDIPANRNWVCDGDNGLLYPCREVKALAQALVRGLNRPEWRTAVMSKNWEIVRARASWSRSMKEMEEQYGRLLGVSR